MGYVFSTHIPCVISHECFQCKESTAANVNLLLLLIHHGRSGQPRFVHDIVSPLKLIREYCFKQFSALQVERIGICC